jgi:hypothetical protein
VPAPGEIDAELGEFWVDNPWAIFQQHNLSCYERNRLYLNAGDGVFVDTSHVSGADNDGDGRSAIPVDFDHDGRLDLLVRQVGGGPLLAYANRMAAGSYLDVTLRGVESNRLGVGARLTAHVGERRVTRERFPENTFRAQAPVVTHFGLGDADEVDRLVIRWPSGLEQTVVDIPANQHVIVTEGVDELSIATPGEIIPPAE